VGGHLDAKARRSETADHGVVMSQVRRAGTSPRLHQNVELVRSIGADHVIDYTNEDFTNGGRRYDLILDNVGNHSMSATRRALTANGTLLSNGGGHAGGKLGRVIRTAIVSTFVRQQGKPSVKSQNPADLKALRELVEARKLTPVIDSTYPLRETPRAIAHVAAGHARGTVVIAVPGLAKATVSPENSAKGAPLAQPAVAG
jgi:NADPH:quinone reductase-like Zn-dependent oxidoreductase